MNSLYIGNRKFLKSYKRNTINGDLYRSWKISSKFCHEENESRNKFSSPEYPMRYVNSVIHDFESKEHDLTIPSYLFDDFESKPIILISVSSCNENEKLSKQLLKKLKVFTKEK